MIYKTINLKHEYPNLKYDATLTAYCPDNFSEIDINRNRPALLIFPGGAYQVVSSREAEPVALRFLGFDLCIFVLNYSVFPHTEYPYPMIEAFAALDYIHKHSFDYHVDTKKVYALGFSAGGHLAATIGAYKDTDIPKKLLGNDINVNIAGLLLGYPVIALDPAKYPHSKTQTNLCFSDPEKLLEFYSIEKHITPQFPRTYAFGHINDPWIPHENITILIEKLKENNVEYKVHAYEGKVHGFSLCDRSVYDDNFDLSTVDNTKEWYKEAIEFIKGE